MSKIEIEVCGWLLCCPQYVAFVEAQDDFRESERSVDLEESEMLQERVDDAARDLANALRAIVDG